MKLKFRQFDDICWKYMLAYKKRTIFTILSIMLAVILFFGTGTIYTSVNQANFKLSRLWYGDYDAEGIINPEEYQRMRKLDYIDEMVLQQTEDGLVMENGGAEQYVYITYLNTYEQNIFPYEPIEGRTPETAQEFMVGKNTADYLGLQVGDAVTLYQYEYWYEGTCIGDRNAAYEYTETRRREERKQGNEDFELTLDDLDTKSQASEFTIAGIYDDDATTSYTGIMYDVSFLSLIDMSQNPTSLQVCVKFQHHKNYIDKLVKDEGIWLDENYEVTRYRSGYNGGRSDLDNLLQYILFVLAFAIIFWISVIIIRNSFVLSMAERARDYGILRCMGINQGKLRRILMLEGFAMSGIASVLGMGITVFLIEVGSRLAGFRKILQSMGVYDTFHVWVQPWMIAATIVFIGCAVLFSLIEPARQISNMEPVGAINGRNSIKKEKIKRRRTGILRKLLGTEGEYAYKNMMRNPGKFIATMVGIAISVTGIVIGVQLIHLANDIIRNDMPVTSIYDASCTFLNSTGKTEKDIEAMCQALNELDSVESIKVAYEKIFWAKDGNGMPIDRDDDPSEYQAYMAIGITEAQLQELEPLLLEGTLDYDALQSGGVIVCRYAIKWTQLGGEWHESKDLKTNLTVGDTLWIQNHTIACPVIAVLDYTPSGGVAAAYFSKDYYQQKVIDEETPAGGFSGISVQCSQNYKSDEINEFNKTYRKYGYWFWDGGVHEEKELLKGYVELLGLITAIIIAIGACNIFNTLSSNISLRKKEIQMMHAVGMSYRQIIKMLSLEGGLGSIFGSCIGMVLGLLAGYELTQFGSEVDYSVAYKFPWEGIIISVVLVALITGISMLIARNEIRKWDETDE